MIWTTVFLVVRPSISSPSGGIGRRAGFKIPFSQGSAGSIPARGTNYIVFYFLFDRYNLQSLCLDRSQQWLKILILGLTSSQNIFFISRGCLDSSVLIKDTRDLSLLSQICTIPSKILCLLSKTKMWD